MKSAKNGYDAKYENVFKDHGGLPVNSQVLESDALVCVCVFYSTVFASVVTFLPNHTDISAGCVCILRMSSCSWCDSCVYPHTSVISGQVGAFMLSAVASC